MCLGVIPSFNLCEAFILSLAEQLSCWPQYNSSYARQSGFPHNLCTFSSFQGNPHILEHDQATWFGHMSQRHLHLGPIFPGQACNMHQTHFPLVPHFVLAYEGFPCRHSPHASGPSTTTAIANTSTTTTTIMTITMFLSPLWSNLSM